MREPCLLCHGPSNLRAAGLDLALGAPLCCAHGWQMDEMIRAERRVHTDGTCTLTCGCMTFEEFDAKWALGGPHCVARTSAAPTSPVRGEG